MKLFGVSSASVSALALTVACSPFTGPDDALKTSAGVGQLRIDARILEHSLNHFVIAVDVTNTGANAIDVGVDPCMFTALYPASLLRLAPVWYEPLACPDIVRGHPTPLPAYATRRVIRDVPLYAYIGLPTQGPDPGTYLVAAFVTINMVDARREFRMETGNTPVSVVR